MGRRSVTVILAILLAACAPSPTAVPPSPTVSPTQPPLDATAERIPRPTWPAAPTRTPAPTPTATPVPTPLPITPLEVRTWDAAPVLVSFGAYGGDSGDPFASYLSLPRLLLYADGRLIATEYVPGEGDRILQTRLDRPAVCALLNTIDQAGFFDYDPAHYDENQNLIVSDGGGTTIISVHAWRSRYVAHYDLWDILQDEPAPWVQEFLAACGCFSLALRDTYRLLDAYAPAGAEPYLPHEVLLLVTPDPFGLTGPPWPISAVSLGQVSPETEYAIGRLLLHGEEARAVYQELGGTVQGQVYSEGDRYFYVLARPLLPYESVAGAESPWQIPSTDVPTSTVELTCYPEDGVLAIP